MVKQLQKIGNSRGLVLERSLLQLLKVEDEGAVEIVPRDDGLLIRKVDKTAAYEEIAQRHRASLDKLAE